MSQSTTMTCTSEQVSISNVLRDYSAKLLARWAASSVSAAEKWRTGDRTPSADKRLDRMRENEEIAARLLGRDVP